MKASQSTATSQPLRDLPRDKKTLDFILKKLSVNSSPARYEMLEELLEMHRTCAGFDPFALTKGRLKRFRSAELKQVLAELEQEVKAIVTSGEYIHQLEDSTRHQALVEQYANMVSLLSAPPSRELNDQVDQFVTQLEQENANELLLSFFHQANKHFLNRTKNLDVIIDTYSSLIQKLNFQNEFLLCGFQTANLLSQSTRPQLIQEKLLAHFKKLENLFLKSANDSGRYELLLQMTRIGLLMTNRISCLSPCFNEIVTDPNGVKLNELGQKLELMTKASIYYVEEDLESRIRNLNLLGEEARKFEDKQAFAFIKYGKALLLAEKEQYNDATNLLNEAEHLLYRNGFKRTSNNVWVDICILRLYIFFINTKRNQSIFEETTYVSLIQVLRDAMADYSSWAATLSGLSGIKEFINNNLLQAEQFLEAAIHDQKSQPCQFNKLIFEVLLLKIKSEETVNEMNAAKKELSALKEPFYSIFVEQLLIS